MNWTGSEIVLGVTGGIAAYKSAEIVSRLRRLGAGVSVIMTKNATEFISPLTFRTLSANEVAVDTFRAPEYWNVEHVALAKKADVFVIAPATANVLAKMAHGIADDMLSTTVLATKAPVLAAPAMNTGMWTADATRENVRILRERGVRFVGPDSGRLACGDSGAGRMSEPEEIVEAIGEILKFYHVKPQEVPDHVFGTPAYISPEQVYGDVELDCRADIYSLAATLYHLSTGRLLFPGLDNDGMMRAHCDEATQANDPRAYRPELSEGFCQLLELMLVKNRDFRIASWTDVFQMCRDIEAGATFKPREPNGANSSIRLL